MSYTDIYSRPNQLLTTHLVNVAEHSYDLMVATDFKYHDSLYDNVCFLIGLCHDYAKTTSFFQEYVFDNSLRSKNTRHSLFSSIFTYYAIDNYFKQNNIQGHDNLSLLSFMCVLRHHGNLKNYTGLGKYVEDELKDKYIHNQLKDLKNKIPLADFYKKYGIDVCYFLDNFNDIVYELQKKLYQSSIDMECYNIDYLLFYLLYSILLNSDKMDASCTERITRKNIPANIIDDYKKEYFKNNSSINIIREEAYTEVNNNILGIDLDEDKILSINLPTGIGKTLTGVNAALKLRQRIIDESGFIPRIIYSLPFLSIIDQVGNELDKIFNYSGLIGNDYLLKHNYLSEMKYVTSYGDKFDLDNSTMLIEGWDSEFIITTFIQLFNTLLGNKNGFARKFHNITNSIIILDEIQNIPYKYWDTINYILKKLCYEYNCYIIIMTATQPLIFNKEDVTELVYDKKYYFKKFNRVKYNFNLKSKLLHDFKEEFLQCILDNPTKNIMCVLNTIDSSRELFKYVKENYVGNASLVYLSSNITPVERLERINLIKNSDNCIVITTQLIEAGVDISMDIIYRDFAPLDSIIQTAGRCNRNNDKESGEVNIIRLNDNKRFYYNYIYDSLLINNTLEVIKEYNTIDENVFNNIVPEKYFKSIKSSKNNEETLITNIINLDFEEINKQFKLIKQDQTRIDVFVCINEEAENIIMKYKYIQDNYNGFIRKNKFLEIKKDYYNYLITIPEKHIGSTNMLHEGLALIKKDDLPFKYDENYGFIPFKNEGALIY